MGAIRIACVLAIAAALAGMLLHAETRLLLSTSFWVLSPIGPLPFLTLLVVAAVFYAAERRLGHVEGVLRLAIFVALSLVFSPSWRAEVAMLFALVGFHAWLRLLPTRSAWDRPLVVGCYLSLMVPTALFLLHTPVPEGERVFLLFYRIQFVFRLHMYVWETRMSGAMRDRSLNTYLEYLYCPFFFLIPNLLFLLPPSYVMTRKRTNLTARSLKSAMLLAVWGTTATLIFQLGEQTFRERVLPPFLGADGAPGFLAFWLGGAAWMVFWYLHHAGGVSLQVASARLFGYQLEYDMNWPFLSRTPLEYFRRFHFFVRNYALEFYYRPIILSLCRRGLGPRAAQILAAGLSYLLLSAPFVGWRLGEQERPLSVGLAMGALLPVLLVVSFSLEAVSRGRKGPALQPGKLRETLRIWGWVDWGMVAVTLLLLTGSKALLSWARYHC